LQIEKRNSAITRLPKHHAAKRTSNPQENAICVFSDPRKFNSLAAIAIIGNVISPPNLNCTIVAPGCFAWIPDVKAEAAPEHSYSASKYP
jgi:hypothetical protein